MPLLTRLLLVALCSLASLTVGGAQGPPAPPTPGSPYFPQFPPAPASPNAPAHGPPTGHFRVTVEVSSVLFAAFLRQTHSVSGPRCHSELSCSRRGCVCLPPAGNHLCSPQLVVKAVDQLLPKGLQRSTPFFRTSSSAIRGGHLTSPS